MNIMALLHDFDVTRLTPDVVRAIAEQRKYGVQLRDSSGPALAEMTDPYTVAGKSK